MTSTVPPPPDQDVPDAAQIINDALVTSPPTSTPVPVLAPVPPPTPAFYAPLPPTPTSPTEPEPLDDRYEVTPVGFHCRICNKDWDKLVGIRLHLVSLGLSSHQTAWADTREADQPSVRIQEHAHPLPAPRQLARAAREAGQAP